jgi:hypothetical protein
MSHYYCDYQQVSISGMTVEDTDGTKIDDECYLIPVLIPVSEVAELLLNYDAADSASPSTTYSRPLSRVILDAIKRAEAERTS